MEAVMAVKIREVKINDVFPIDKYPQLYSKRGFEKKRIKFIIPDVRDKLMMVTDTEGNTLTIL